MVYYILLRTRSAAMILSVRVNNYHVYSNDAELSLIADMRIKKFGCNVYKQNKFNVLKSACIYGANNSGKTSFIMAIASIKNVLLGLVADVTPNLFIDSKVCSFGVSFFSGEKVYSYDFKYDSTLVNNIKNGFVYECLKELSIDNFGNQTEKEIFVRDTVNEVYRFAGNDELSKVLGLVSSNNILIYTINPVKYPVIEEYRKVLREFASNIEVLDMNNIPITKTIEVLKNNEDIKDRTVELIKLADLDIEDYKYVKNDPSADVYENSPKTPQELVLAASVQVDDMFRLTSVHKGKPLLSLQFDSTGTKKIVAVASYIIDALDNGKTLVIDEFDSSLHFKLTRALVSLFNNDLNKNAQLLFTAHDITLLDCKKLFRKDQIWFADKDSDGAYLYSLADFTSLDDHIRSDTDMMEKYSQGKFGALPEPDLIAVLLNSDKGE